jgi:mRNA interferase RelE/StbE
LAYLIEWQLKAKKELEVLDPPVQKKILRYLRERACDNPRTFGGGLIGDMAGIWRYRVENYRILCRIDDNKLIILVVAVGHRKSIYD